MECSMKLSNGNILGQFLPKNHKYLGSISLLFMVLTVVLWGISHLVHAASANSVEHGIEAFKQGDFTRAKSVLSQYVDANTVDTTQVQVYLFAMEETPTRTLSIHMIQDIIHRSVEGDSTFKIMEARLHLLGLHPQANTQEGIKILESLAHTQGYAAYSLGLYFEGALDGIKRDEAKAKSWYETAKENHYVQAMVKLYVLAKDGKIRRPAGNTVAEQLFPQILKQPKAPKATGPLPMQQLALVKPLKLLIKDFRVRSGSAGKGNPLALVPESVETKDNPKSTPITLLPSIPAEPVVVCREGYALNRHPQTMLADTLPDLSQKPIQNQLQSHPINPIEQLTRNPTEQLTREGLKTSYPLLGNASHWGDFLYQRKMGKLSQGNIKFKEIK